MKQLLCLFLVSLLLLGLAGCGEEPTGDTSSVVEVFIDDSELDNAFQIIEPILFFGPQENGNMVMEIAKNTKAQDLHTAIYLQPDFEAKVLDQKGTPVENDMDICDGMTFNVYEKSNPEPLFSYVLQTVDESVIQEFYQSK